MRLSATLARDELALVLESLTPLRVTIDPRRDRVVTFDHPSVELVPDRGIRVRGEARLTWDLAGVAIPLYIQTWQVLLEPRIERAAGRRWLMCAPIVEILDLKHSPAVLDGKLRDAVEGALAKARDRLAWDFGKTLSRRLFLPARVAPTKALDLVVTDGACTLTETELRLDLELVAQVPARAVRTEVAPLRAG